MRVVAVLKDLETEVEQLTTLMTDIKEEYLEIDSEADEDLTQTHDEWTSVASSDN